MNKSRHIGIFIPTINRSDFVIRQLKYYAAVQCPHTIYIGDSSNQENSNKIKETIRNINDLIKIVYKYIPSLNNKEAIQYLLSIIEEPYACFSGDDDYQISDSLIKCAEFLENNPDHATASGYAVSFRLKNNSVRGELDRIANYPRPNVEAETAQERLVKYFEHYCVPLFSVNRTKQMLKNWEKVNDIKDASFGPEIVPSALSIIAGKSATLDCLGFVRQIHDRQYELPNTFDWITSPEWQPSYALFEKIISENLAVKDNTSIEDATKVTKQSFWAYLQKYLAKEYNELYSPKKEKGFYENIKNLARANIVAVLPSLKHIYRMQIRPRMTGKKELNFEVLQPNSKYYKDFKPVMDSFTGQIKI